MTGENVLAIFKNVLSNYSDEQLRYISNEGVWSLGQMFDHIIIVAHEYLDSVEMCSTINADQALGKTPSGKKLFEDGGFPPIKIRLPEEMNASPNNSGTGETLKKRIEELIERLEYWTSKVEAINPNSKAEHGGFGWLNAKEWFELVEMHSRHHVRQKEELESYLKKVL